MWHKLTPLFAKTAMGRIATVNNHRSHFSLIQQKESGAFKSPIIKNVPAISDCYVHFPSMKTNKIVKLLE